MLPQRRSCPRQSTRPGTRWSSMIWPRNWAATEKESARALELNPTLEEAHFVRSYVLRPLNRLDEALQAEKRAMELDPFSEPQALVYILIRMRQFDAALNEA